MQGNNEHTTGVVEVPLTKGKVALIDAEDASLVLLYSWYAQQGGTRWYAVHRGRGKTTYMHRLVMQAPHGMDVDHLNCDGLDNRRSCNLRLASRSQNLANQRVSSQNTSGYKGVSWDRRKQRWVANARSGQRRYYQGYFRDKIEAARAYDRAVRARFGSFARTNFPE